MIGISATRDEMQGSSQAVIDGVHNGILQAVEKGYEVSQDEVPVRSGELKDSGKVVTSTAEGDTVTFRYTADHAMLVEEGTAPHPIMPDEADALKFEVGGETVFAKHVEHPGTPPQPYVQPGFKAMAQELEQRGLSPHISGELDRQG